MVTNTNRRKNQAAHQSTNSRSSLRRLFGRWAQLNLFSMQQIIMVTSFIIIISLAEGHNQDSIYTAWSHSYGTEYNESPVSIRKHPRTGYIIAGKQWGPNRSTDVWISKIDSNGIEEWYNTTDFNGSETLSDVELLSNNSMLLTGKIDSKVWIAKVDSAGDSIWSNLYFESDWSNQGKDIEVISNSSILIAGTKHDSVLLINIDSNGTILWQYTYSFFEHSYAEGIAVDKLPDGRIVIGANIIDMISDYQTKRPAIYFIDSSGLFLDLEIFENDVIVNPLVDIEVVAAGNILLLGWTHTGPNYEDAYLMLIDTSGVELWTNFYGSWNLEGVSDLNIDNNGNYLVCGYTKGFGIPNNRDFWAFKCDSNGNVIWNYVSGSSEIENGKSIISIDRENYLLTGYLSSYDTLGSQIIVQKLSETELGTYDWDVGPHKAELYQNHPNPFNPITTIQYDLPQRSDVQITIYDLVGREVTTLLSETQDAGVKSIQWNATNIPSGMYFYQIRAGEFVQIRKMVVLK